MQFENMPWLIVGLLASAGLGWAFHAAQKGRIQALSKFASGQLLAKLTESVSPGKRRLKQALLILAVFSLFVGLARPQVGFRWEEARRKGIDIMLAVDTSKSMLARDVAPNRLERSKLAIMDFVEKLGGDRVGLIPFAGEAFLMTPLTLDYAAFLESLRAMDTRTIPRGGTNVAAAIQEADRAFVDDAKQKLLVLITDGEDLEGAGLAAAKEARDRGITIHTIGVGTPAGELIPAGNRGPDGRFVKDGDGQVVKSRLDEGALKEIAHVTGGTYHPLGRRGEGLIKLYGEQLNLIPKQELSERMKKVPIERFTWPLSLALLFLLLEFMVGDRKSRRALRVPDVETADRRVARGRKMAGASAALGLAAMLVTSWAQASPQEALKAYTTGDFEAAEQYYDNASQGDPGNHELRYNLGVAAYKSGNFDKSVDALQATLKSTDLGLQNEAYYSLGNALYRKGQATEKSKPEATIEQWEQALKSYEGAMELDRGDADAKFNYEFVKKKLEELKKKQQQQQNQQNKQNQDQQEDQQDKQQQSKQNQQQQDQQDQQNEQNNKQDKKDQNNSQSQQSQGEQDKNKDESGKDQKEQDQKSAQNEKDENDQKPQDQKQQNAGQGSKPEDQDGQRKDQQQAKGKDADQKEETKKQNGGEREEKRQPEPGSGEVQQAKGKAGEKMPDQHAGASREKPTRPGRMSQEEAERLLDSLKRDDEQVSFLPDKKGSARASRDQDYKDW